MSRLFFLHGGYILLRLGRQDEANKIFEDAAEAGLIPCFWQRSLKYVNGLNSKPIWDLQETGIGYILETIRKKWTIFRDEALIAFKNKLV